MLHLADIAPHPLFLAEAKRAWGAILDRILEMPALLGLSVASRPAHGLHALPFMSQVWA
jgi:hypothetical protein